MKLSARARFGFHAEPYIALVGRKVLEGQFPLQNIGATGPQSTRLRLGAAKQLLSTDEIGLPEELDYVAEGDILRLNPFAGEARILYRRDSRHNVLFFTERCNSRCLMCSQPPRELDDQYLVEDILRMLPWMGKDTLELGITGGEPTLLQGKLIEVIVAAKRFLPATGLHMLSNGRLFSYLRFAQRVADAGHSNFMVGVPLYADTASAHDFVVQAKGAFEQTIFGVLNLARVGVRVEIRMVVHQQTYARLPQFARFVLRNLPFVDQVVIMGLEMTGFTRSNLEALWIDPVDYQEQLEQSIRLLDDAGIAVHIYNHQLCLLRPSLRSFAQKSISDWKNIYLPECDQCLLKSDCGGLFQSATLRHSPFIQPIRS